ncbi:Glucose/arabinose dehydrogenase, beta-propeller fold [Loktanella atrilutea]|uniref:Glucose/arabinose dehydrogenase, beta-propeller fold n=1 Tax=Loktanella atrilutea TaxID=366533 RepID=A0A1M4VD57_LOKAT|nr:PQQ-dependent sugar dehydrogenase [Loktanella atrilutea]SHE66889.1 Glucose/arabinose dehydrogenase, beta-propeller fold [Loktanella atrilutea]
MTRATTAIATILTLAAAPGFAQDAPEKGSPLEGRPETEAAQKLAPESPPALPTEEADLPLDMLKAPDGFTVEVYASGINNARTLRVAEDGTVFVGNWQGNDIYVIPAGGGEPRKIYEGLDWPNGLALHDGDLYIAEHTKISVAEDIMDNLDNPPELKEIYSELGEPRPHGWRFLAVGPDEKLYVSNSSPCNICAREDGFGEIRRMELDGTGAEPILTGMRNTVGFDFHPETANLWFTDNQRDWLSEDIPQDELNVLTEEGQDFGFPYCHNGLYTDPEFGWGRQCSEFADPVALLGPHTAPLGMRFYTAESFPEDYRGQIFIAKHGPWNRTEKAGAEVAVAYLDGETGIARTEPFLTGFIQDNRYVGRPVDVDWLPDGSMLVSDDWNGAVYRVSYDGQ